MRKNTAIKTMTGLGLAAALALSGCSASSETPATPDASTTSEAPAATTEPTATETEDMSSEMVTDTVNSDGATLRASLTALLSDHVYLAAAALDQAVTDGGDLTTADVEAAVATLDKNTVEIAALVGSAYPDAEQPFLDSWRSHIPYFVDYTIAKATDDQAGMDEATAGLEQYAVSFGELINSVIPDMPAEAVQAELETHATSLVAAIDANVEGDPAYFDLLKEAAGHMPMTATALSSGIAADKGIQ